MNLQNKDAAERKSLDKVYKQSGDSSDEMEDLKLTYVLSFIWTQ